MAWKHTNIGTFGDRVSIETAIAAPASAIPVYSTEIDFLPIHPRHPNRYISILAEGTGDVTSTHVEVALYGSAVAGGTKFQLVDNIVTALTNAAKTAGARLDLNDYPAPFYYIAFTSDGDDTTGTALVYKVSIYAPQIGG